MISVTSITVVLAALAIAIVLSIRLRSGWPYVLVAIVLLASRALVLRYARLVAAPKPEGISWLWFFVLAAFVALLSRWP